MAKHITFISAPEHFYKNEEFVKDRFFKHFNPNVHDHIEDGQVPDVSNLLIVFGKDLLTKLYPDQTFEQIFKTKEGQYVYSFKNYKDFDTVGRREQNTIFSRVKKGLDVFFSKYAITKVSYRYYFYRNTEFKRIKAPNPYRGDTMYIEDPDGEYLSYDYKKLKKVSTDYKTSAQTYEGHLNGNQHFYYENFPKLAHSKILSYLTFDIETDFSLDVEHTPKPIISIVGYSNAYDATIVWVLKNDPAQQIEYKADKTKVLVFSDEAKMLASFFNFIQKFQIDLLGGWNTHKFDFPYLINRARLLGIMVDDYIDNIYTKSGKDGDDEYFSNSLIFWDYLKYMKWTSFNFKPVSWSLNDVSKHLFKEEKVSFNVPISDLWKNDPKKLIEYNIQDVYLTEKINLKKQLIAFPLLYQQICPQNFENVFFNSKTIEHLLHLRFKQFKFPTKMRSENAEKFEGAVVTDPVPGIHENVFLLDFASLYPSIIITFGLSPENIIPERGANGVEINGICFRQDRKGIMSELNRYLVEQREQIKKKRATFPAESAEFKIYGDMESTYKTLANSLYGVMGFPGFIMYDRRVAESVTYVGRELIRFVNKKAEENDFTPLFGDTDSIFLKLNEKIDIKEIEKVAEKGKALEKFFNTSLPEYIQHYTNNREVVKNSVMKIALDKIYSKLLLTSAKKKQAGYIVWFKGKFLNPPELYIKGFEAIKDDIPAFFKPILNKFYCLMLDEYGNYTKFHEYAKMVRTELKKQPVEKLLVRKRLAKHLTNYDALPIHIRALRNSGVSLKKGEYVNMVFVKDERGVIHYSPELDLKFEIDWEKYYTDFFKNKVELIDEKLYYHMFLEKTKLVDTSAMHVAKRIVKKPKIQSLA